MFQNTSFPVVRLTAMATSKVMKAAKNGKVSGKAIKDMLKENPNLEFIDAMTGQYLTIAEAKKVGAKSLEVRFNRDQSVVMIPVK